MKNHTALLLIVFLLPVMLLASPVKKEQLLPPGKTLAVLADIEDDAITFGHGEHAIHTFIDPYCELSQRYLAFIFKKQDRMFSKYTFYFYLYELDGKASSEVITTILSSDDRQTALKAVMLSHQNIPYADDVDAEDAVEHIKDAADRIGVFKRPYILINGKVK